jgi:hypothetical protein
VASGKFNRAARDAHDDIAALNTAVTSIRVFWVLIPHPFEEPIF